MRLSHQQGPGSYEGPVPSEVPRPPRLGKGPSALPPIRQRAAPARGGEPTSNGVVAPAKPSSFLDRAGLARASSVGWGRPSSRGRRHREQQILLGLRVVADRLDTAEAEQITAIATAHHAGLSVRKIAAAIRLSPAQVHQLLHTPAAQSVRAWSRAPADPPHAPCKATASLLRESWSLAGPPVPRWARCREPAPEHRSGDRGRADRSPAGAPGVAAPDQRGTWGPGRRARGGSRQPGPRPSRAPGGSAATPAAAQLARGTATTAATSGLGSLNRACVQEIEHLSGGHHPI